jgi:hypothetical protein
MARRYGRVDARTMGEIPGCTGRASDDDGAVVVSLRSEDRGMSESLALEVMAHDRSKAEHGEGLDLAAADAEAIVDELDGVSPAFIRELLRRAALLAAEESDGSLRVGAAHLRRAVEELTLATNNLTQRLLGARAPTTEAGSQHPDRFSP